jgi:F-type H+-transporting ATPase subunit b
MAKSEQESQQVLVRAQEEIRAERDRVFQELRAQVAEISVELAGRVVGEELDQNRHERLIQDYIDQVARSGNGSAN